MLKHCTAAHWSLWNWDIFSINKLMCIEIVLESHFLWKWFFLHLFPVLFKFLSSDFFSVIEIICHMRREDCKWVHSFTHWKNHVFRRYFNVAFLVFEVFLDLCEISNVDVCGLYWNFEMLCRSECLLMACLQVTIFYWFSKNILNCWSIPFISDGCILRFTKQDLVSVTFLQRFSGEIARADYHVPILVFISCNSMISKRTVTFFLIEQTGVSKSCWWQAGKQAESLSIQRIIHLNLLFCDFIRNHHMSGS